MLNRIEITGLYGHYTYDLPLSSGQRKDICFLTGPNGYGKSTILDLVYAFIKADAKTLVGIPYDTITFYLKDYKVNLKQERYEVEGDPNDDSSSSDDESLAKRNWRNVLRRNWLHITELAWPPI